MPQMAVALDVARVRPLIEPLVGGTLLALALRRHKPGRRCLIEYRFGRDAGGEFALVGKVRAKGLDRRAFEIAQSIHAAGFDDRTAATACVPRPVGVVPDLNMWLMERAPGDDFRTALASLGPAEIARRAAEALLALHRGGVDPGRRHSLDDELAILSARLHEAAAARPDLAARITAVEAACRKLAGEIDARPTVPIHRDFYHDQLLFAEPARTYLLDLDLCSLGDPALDAGNFVAHLLESAVRTPDGGQPLLECATKFAAAYADGSTTVSQQAIDWYTTLSLARHVWISTRFADRTTYTDAILGWSEARLSMGTA